MKFIAIAVAVAAFTVSSPVQAGKFYSDQLCQAWFKKLDRNRDGSIGGGEDPQGYVERATLSFETGRSRSQFIVSRTFFIRECGNGIMGKPRV
jgi:hypothetical protein